MRQFAVGFYLVRSLLFVLLLEVGIFSQFAIARAGILDFMPAILAGVQNFQADESSCQVGCGERTGGYQVPMGLEVGTGECILRTNPKYYPLPWPHTYDNKAFFELCGNYHTSVPEPSYVLKSKELGDRFLTLWMEVNAPFGKDGTVWFDGVCLTVGDSDDNLAPNQSFCTSMDADGWDSKENPIHSQYPEFPVCMRGVSDYANCNTIEGIVQDEYKFSGQSLRVDVKAGYRYHTYIDYKYFIDLRNFPIGTKINASVYVRIEGDVQVRLGFDTRVNIDDVLPVKMLNGKIVQFKEGGPYFMVWTLLTL